MRDFLISILVVLLRGTALTKASAFCTGNPSERPVSGETASVAVLAAFLADASIKLSTIFSSVGSSGFDTASFSSSHN